MFRYRGCLLTHSDAIFAFLHAYQNTHTISLAEVVGRMLGAKMFPFSCSRKQSDTVTCCGRIQPPSVTCMSSWLNIRRQRHYTTVGRHQAADSIHRSQLWCKSCHADHQVATCSIILEQACTVMCRSASLLARRQSHQPTAANTICTCQQQCKSCCSHQQVVACSMLHATADSEKACTVTYRSGRSRARRQRHQPAAADHTCRSQW